jgi:hypothetical protein
MSLERGNRRSEYASGRKSNLTPFPKETARRGGPFANVPRGQNVMQTV